MRALPTYPRTKPTTIPWIGEVPEHWEVVQLRRFVSMQSGESITAEDIKEEGDHAVFGGNGLRGYTGSFTHDGDHVLIGRQGALCGNVNYATGKFWASEHAVVVTPLKASATRWLGELMRTMNLNQYSQSAAQPGLAVDVIKGLYVPLPPLLEQTHIARYLSYKTALIDAYLVRKRRMMALLKEQRQALISQAVTKGLDPNAPMKDSGVEWIGEVPEHWEVSRVKHMCSVLGRIGFRGYEKDDLVEPGEGALVIGGKHIGDDRLELGDPVYLSWAKYHESPEIMIEQGDIVVTQRGSLGKVAVIDQALGPATINPSMILLKEIGCDSSFFGYFFKSAFFKSYIDLINTSTAVPMISQDQLGNISVPLPPREEQLAIVQSLNDKLNLIDDELTRIQASMERVQEYRLALISAVVTGKVDVRGVEVPEIDQTMSGSEDQTMEEEFVLSSDGIGTGTDVDGIAEL